MMENVGLKKMIGRVFKTLSVSLALAGSIGGFSAQARTMDVNTPSEEQIRSRVQGLDLSLRVAYAEDPVTQGSYAPGLLTDAVQQSAIDTLNAMRFIAGVPDHVSVDSTYIGYAQAGALVNYVNGKMEHTPKNEHGIDEALFQKGYTGTSQGNLHSSTSASISMNNAIVTGWLADSGNNNLATVGHRRWCLNPAMGRTGFGAVSGSKGSYACMYAFDKSGSASCSTVSWPAQTMPTEYFGTYYPWSISSNTAFSSDTVVTLSRNRNGNERKWQFSSVSSDGYFKISNEGYGMPGCVIFRPSGVGSYQDGDIFTVKVTEGGNETLSYTVRFFSLVKAPDDAGIGFFYNVRGVKVGEQVYNNIELTDDTISMDKIAIDVEDESIVEISLAGKTVWITGKQEGETKITVSLPNGLSSTCTVKVFGETHVHDYSLTKVVREATCYMKGIEVRDLCECGASKSGYYYPIDLKPHTLKVDPGYPATCTEAGLSDGKHCEVCHKITVEQTKIDALGHEEVIDKAVAPTCTQTGLEEGMHCARCSKVLKEQAIVAALGHVETEAAEIPATCTKEGRAAGKYCSRCEEVLEGMETLAVVPHVAEEVAAVEPTCTDTGLTIGSRCAVCGVTLIAQETIAAKGHTKVLIEEEQPTCTEAGLTQGLYCSVCNVVLEKQETIPALGHDLVVKEKGKEATCLEAGRTDYITCTRCDYEEKAVDISPLGHVETAAAEIPATCTEEGRAAGKYCSRCEEVLKGMETLAIVPHVAEEVAAVEPTCTDTGLTIGSRCAVCGVTLTEQETIAALGHEATVLEEIPATLTEEGKTEGIYCSRCGKVLKEQETIPKLQPSKPTSPAKGTILKDKKSGGTYTVSSAGASGKATVEYKVSNGKNTSVTIPDTVVINKVTYKVTSVAKNAFKNNKKLKKVKLGKNITEIGANAFYGCSKLTSVSLGANTVTIGAKAFYKCTALKSITVPAKVTTIGKEAFSGCRQLRSITIKTTNLTANTVGGRAFSGIYSKATIKVPKKSLNTYKKLLKKKGIGTKVKIKK